MKIEDHSINKTIEGQLPGIAESRHRSVDKGYGLKNIYTNDNVEISGRGIEFNRIKSVIMAIPDIREEKTARLADEVNDGSYKVEAELIEAMLLKEHILNSIL